MNLMIFKHSLWSCLKTKKFFVSFQLFSSSRAKIQVIFDYYHSFFNQKNLLQVQELGLFRVNYHSLNNIFDYTKVHSIPRRADRQSDFWNHHFIYIFDRMIRACFHHQPFPPSEMKSCQLWFAVPVENKQLLCQI